MTVALLGMAVRSVGRMAAIGLLVAGGGACTGASGTHLNCTPGGPACVCAAGSACVPGLACVGGLCLYPNDGSAASSGSLGVSTSIVTSTLVLADGGTTTITSTTTLTTGASSTTDTGTTSTQTASTSGVSTSSFTNPFSSSASTSSSTPQGHSNLITDGDFSNPSSTLWGLTGTGIANATLTVSGNEGCVAEAGTSVSGTITLGWPSGGGAGVVLSSANSYTFSYTVRTYMGTATIEAKVGHTTTPFTADVDSTTDTATATLQTYAHPFSGKADTSAGVAFSFYLLAGQTVCFSAVSLM